MAYTENFAHLVFGGTAWAGNEQWSCSTKLKQIGGDSPTAMQDNIIEHLPAVAEAVRLYFVDGNAGFGGHCKLGWVRLNVINKTTGRYAFPNAPQLFEFDPVVNSAFGVGIPQVAYCVTLRSSIKRGPGARGRWFVPLAAPGGLQPNGKMPAVVPPIYATAAADFLQRLANLGGIGDTDPFAPWLYGQGAGGAADSAVQTVSVGDVFDTQRRRRNQLEEIYYDGGYDATQG